MCAIGLHGLVTVFGLAASHAPVSHQIEVYFHVIQRPIRVTPGSSSKVLWPGDRAVVEAWAHPPADAYAFASAEFEVEAEPGLPGWIVFSDGRVDGPRVTDISVSQPHSPAEGVFADPSNPIQIWTGSYAPESIDPRLLRVQATPGAFSYYPSKTVGDSIEVEATGGGDWLLINPVEVGETLVAPGAGATLGGGDGDDILIGGTTGFEEEIVFGFVAPEGARVGIAPENPPTRVTIETTLEEAGATPQRSRVTSLTVTFSQTVNLGTYQLQPDWPLADEYEYRINTVSGRTIRLRFAATNNQGTLLQLQGLPSVYSTQVRTLRRENETRVISRMEYEVPARVLLPDGRAVNAETIEVHAVQHNLKQIGIGAHVVHGQGAGKVHYSDMCCP